jgi:hypothetical protein
MKTHSQLSIVFASISILAFGPATWAADATPSVQNKVSKEVITQVDGKDRHWLIKSNAVIIEEHGLTAHGDLHVMAEYPKGVRTPQLDASAKATNVESVVTMFWRDGTRMSRTPMIGEKSNGLDRLWWPNGKIFREAEFVMGTPAGVWNYYDKEARLIGKGTFRNGTRQSGLFIGDNRAGYFFFFTNYPIKQQTFENGVLKEEKEFLKELNLEEK